MAVVLSRRGFLGGVLASVSIAALPLPEVASTAVRTAVVPVDPQPFIVILDEVGYYMPDDLGLLADAFRFEFCTHVDVEAEASEPAEVGRACVAALKNGLAGRGMQQEALFVRRTSHMATVA